MKKFVVNKNLEREPRIQGYRPNFYYVLFVLQIAFLLLFFICGLFILGNATASHIVTYLISLGGSLAALLVLRKQFKKLSNQTKYRFGKKRSVLSNRDLLKQL